ncbi:MAG: hypothetical protein WBA16_00505 [Nonlabens sp.]
MASNRFKNLPKADVHSHLHLGASIERFKEQYPAANFKVPNKYDGLTGMIEFIYGTLNNYLKDGRDVYKFIDAALMSCVDDNVILVEASVDLNLSRFMEGSIEELIEMVAGFKLKYQDKLNFKPEIGVNKDLDLQKVYNYGIKCIESGVFKGIDLYGQEQGKDIHPFKELYQDATAAGLKTKVHIGEFSNAQSIHEVLDVLNPMELQHGIRSIDDPDLVERLAQQSIRLNITPTSNHKLGAVDSIENHPIQQLYRTGVQVAISTDDLILFGSSVSNEFQILLDNGVLTMPELEKIRLSTLGD